MPNIQSVFFLLLSLILSACTQPAQSPKTIADKYWQYMQAGNYSEAEKLVTSDSRRAMQETRSRMNDVSRIDNSEATTIVSTTITTINPSTGYRHSETFNTVLVLQQGQWKVDLDDSQIPPQSTAKEEEIQQLADELSESMHKNMESMDDAVNQGMQMLNEALEDGSKEMGESLLHLMNQLNHSMKESIEQMKKRREQQEKAQQQQRLKPDPLQGEGMI